MEKLLLETVEGEVSLVIDYEAGKSEALHVLQSAMRLIEGLDALDHALFALWLGDAGHFSMGTSVAAFA